MRIGVDACCWSNKRGFGRFTRELLEAIIARDDKNEYLFFIDRETAASGVFPERVRLIVASTSVSPIEAASASGRRSLKDIWAMSRAVMKHEIDLFFFPAVYSYFPIFNRTKIIVTIHDVIAEHHPELTFPNNKLKMFWKLKQNLALRQSDLIATVSEHSKGQIVEYFNLPESRVRVISEAARPVFAVRPRGAEMFNVLHRYHLSPNQRFLLYVGGISPHKNLNTLIIAYQSLIHDERFADVKLVLVGDYQTDAFYSAYPALKSQVERLDLTEKVSFTGFVEDDDLAYLYSAASVFVLPSLEEGFGLPVIEAMACGTAVVASERGSLPEILGNAGRFFNPLDSQDIENLLRQVLDDDAIRTEMISLGLERAQHFMWDKAAKDALSIFDELAVK